MWVCLQIYLKRVEILTLVALLYVSQLKIISLSGCICFQTTETLTNEFMLNIFLQMQFSTVVMVFHVHLLSLHAELTLVAKVFNKRVGKCETQISTKL